jgi:membrane protein
MARHRSATLTRDGTAAVTPEATATSSGSPHDGDRGRHAQRPGDVPARGWFDVLRRVKAELKQDHTSLSAAGVAFYGFLAAIPALAATVSLYGLFTDPADVQRRVESLFGALPQDAQSLLRDQLTTIVGQTGGALTLSLVVSIALSLWSASSGMAHLIEAINVAYDEQEERNWFVRKGQSLGFTLGAIVFVVVAVAGVAALSAVAERIDVTAPVAWVLRLLWVPLLMAGFGFGLATLYRYGPDRERARWRWVSWGSVVAVAVWIAASIGFQLYVTNFGSYNKTYGALAAVVVLLMWLYLTAFVILLGAQINAELEHQTARDTTTGSARPLGERGAVMADTVAGGPGSG